MGKGRGVWKGSGFGCGEEGGGGMAVGSLAMGRRGATLFSLRCRNVHYEAVPPTYLLNHVFLENGPSNLGKTHSPTLTNFSFYNVQMDAAVLENRLPEVSQTPSLAHAAFLAVPAPRELESACRVSM